LPDGAVVSVVREDSKKKGLLFAGRKTQVYVSFDDGDHWQSLRLNMRLPRCGDLVIKMTIWSQPPTAAVLDSR